MLNQKKLFSDSIIFIIASILNAFFPYILLPILTSFLSPSEFGLIGIFQAFYTIFLSVVSLSVGGAIVRRSYNLNKEQIGIYIFNCILISIVCFVVVLSLLFITKDIIERQLNFPFKLVLYSLLYATCIFYMNIFLGQLQVHQKPIPYGIIQVGNSLLNVILSLIFVTCLLWGADGRVLGMLYSSVIFAVISLSYLYKTKKIILKTKASCIKDAISFGIPLVPHELGTFFMNWFSMIIISKMLDMAAVGIYLFAFQLSMVLGVLCDAFNKAYVPWLFKKLTSGHHQEKIQIIQLTYGYFFLMLIITILTFLIGPKLIEIFFDSRYIEASSLIGMLVLGQALGGMYLMVTNYILYSENTFDLTIATTISSLLGILSLYFLIDHMGIIGAAISYIIARASLFIITLAFSIKRVDMPWSFFIGKNSGS